MSNLKHYSGNVSATHDENPPCGGILHIMESLFLVSLHKTTGTEVADDRESTSYSSAEYSWDPKEKVYR